jgi:2,3-bisphosphoglycerate-dependent phosphoglycerate mutase
MTEPTTLIFVRHGQTVWNSQGRWQGWLDSPLTELGEEQARGVADQLDGVHIDAIYSSDAGRAVQTAQEIAARRGLEPVASPELRERYYGRYEGLNSKEIEQQLPGTRFAAGRDTREGWRPPDGETMAEVRERLRRFLARVVPKHRGRTVLNVTHSGVVRAMDSIVQGRPFDEIWDRVPQNCCIFVVRAHADGSYEVERDFHQALQKA